MDAPATSRVLVVALVTSLIAVCLWIAFAPSGSHPLDRRITNVALSRTGRWLAAGASQGWILLWDRERGGHPLQIRFRHGSLNDLQFSPDEHQLAIANRELGLHAVGQSAGPRLLRSDDRNYGAVRFSSDGQTILVITGKGTIETLDTFSGTTQVNICCSTIYGEVAFSPDGRFIANAGHWPGLWDRHSGRLMARLTKDREFHTFRPIAFDEVRGLVLMGSQDGRVYAWDLVTRQLLGTSPAHSEYVDTIALLMSTDWIAYGGFGKIVRLWNPRTGEDRSVPAARPTSNLLPGQDGASVIFGTGAGVVEFWDVREGKLLRALMLPER